MKSTYRLFKWTALMALLSSLSVWYVAGTGEGEADPLSMQKRRLEEVEREIVRFNRELDSMKTRKKTIVNELMEAACRVELVHTELNKLNLHMSVCESEIIALKERIRILKEEIEEDKIKLAGRLRRIYKMGKGGYLKSLLGTDDVKSLMFGFRYVLFFANRDVKIINETKTDIRELSEHRVKLGQTQSLAESLKRENTEKKAALKTLLRKKEILLARINTDEKYHMALIQDLEKTSIALEEIITGLQNKNIQADENKIIFPLFSLCREKLPWPVKGKVTDHFGKKKDYRFGTYTVRNGIDIMCKPDTPIRAVHDGFVVFSDWFKNYGRLIIIDHQLGYYSLYSHASRIDVTVGRFIRENEVIGMTGDTGLLGTSYLHFEIRKKSKPLNPLEWLEGEEK